MECVAVVCDELIARVLSVMFSLAQPVCVPHCQPGM